ncbi:MAG TPA: hypothetical protein VEH02_04525 [Pseudolabrys sp.]|nr:hypothetical protein [Pseudolabrys sp.]
MFNTIIGAVWNLKGRASADREKCLRLPLVLFEAVIADGPVS